MQPKLNQEKLQQLKDGKIGFDGHGSTGKQVMEITGHSFVLSLPYFDGKRYGSAPEEGITYYPFSYFYEEEAKDFLPQVDDEIVEFKKDDKKYTYEEIYKIQMEALGRDIHGNKIEAELKRDWCLYLASNTPITRQNLINRIDTVVFACIDNKFTPVNKIDMDKNVSDFRYLIKNF